LTVSVVVAPDVPVALAVIVTVPAATPVATPDALIVATAAFDEAQVTLPDPSSTVPSL
jgi:hypothetical protein